MKTTERSRAYPVLSLGESRRVMGEILAGLGDGCFSREVLGEMLGYSNARGGPAARKIAALAQYGFLSRRAGLYSPTALAREAVLASSETERRTALHRALRQPPLFAALLDRYRPQGRVPAQLANVLWRDYGITRKASRSAAETFRKSARDAGMVDRDGTFMPDLEGTRQTGGHSVSSLQTSQTPDSESVAKASQSYRGSEQRFEFALTNGQVAKLLLPLKLSRRDLEIVQKQIDFLHYQIREEEGS